MEDILHLQKMKGVSNAEAGLLQKQYGKNEFHLKSSRHLAHLIRGIVTEPMFIMLVVACSLYFVLGEATEGLMMLAAIIFVTAISIYEEVKSSKALEALQQLTEPKVMVIRNGVEQLIDSFNLVPDDIMLLEEGNKVPADATLLQQNDLTINESIITGESMPVEKDTAKNNFLYQGTTINSGKCYAKVTAIGNATVLGKLGKSINTYSASATLLQQQLENFVRRFTLFGVGAFLLIFVVNLTRGESFVASLLFGLTLAMAAIPEEIPVAFSSFMALGAYHMSRLGIITRQPQTIENLGAVTTICLDKTGTITENKMSVESIYDYRTNTITQLDATDELTRLNSKDVLYYAMLASEQHPFDAMEKAIYHAYEKFVKDEQPHLKMIHEYSLQGIPPMMTHVYELQGVKTAVAKGAVERIVRACRLDETALENINSIVNTFALKGSRIIGVASAVHKYESFPLQQDDFNWQFEGLVSLFDPPKENIKNVFEQFYNAGITIKLLTGDYPETAINISQKVGMRNCKNYLKGEEIMTMSEVALKRAVQRVNMFVRMYPEAKLKVVEALKANGEIVAMTGDGVNDGPALKAADIGIAMGEKGTEIARQAADLILTDDKLEKVAEAVKQGRKIFSNFKKAVRYIISIHIPIVLTASLPLILGWKYPNIFAPVHVIFLELIMGPTCSIFFEREPVEEDIMRAKPRIRTIGLFTKEEILISIVQGLVITLIVLLLYFFYMNNNSPDKTRTIVFTTLVTSNIFLTLVNRSFSETIIKTVRYKNNLALPVLIISILFIVIIHTVPYLRNIFGFSLLTSLDFFICIGSALISVLWFELYKANLNEME